MKALKENWPFYRRRLTVILLILAFILGLHGLYVYYAPVIARPWQLFSAILYGMMKLFLFSPPLGAEADVTWTYEVAKWLAPLLTSALVITTVFNTLTHAWNSLSNRFGRHVIVFDLNEASSALMRNLRADAQPYKVSAVSATPVPQEVQNELERKGIAVYTADFSKAVRKEAEASAAMLRLDHAHALVLTHPDDLVNYDLFIKLLPVLKPKARQTCHVRLTSDALRVYLSEGLLSAQKSRPELSRLDLRFYDQDNLAVDLLTRSGNLLQGNLEGLSAAVTAGTLSTPEAISTALGTPHLLVIGVNELTGYLLRRSVNDLVISLDKPLRVTLIGPSASSQLAGYLENHEMLKHCIDFRTFDTAPGMAGFNEALRKTATDRLPPTCICLLQPEPIENLEALHRLDQYLPNTPVLFRNPTGIDLGPILTNPDRRVTLFGNLRNIMTAEVVLQEKLDQAAIAFNARYNETASAAGSGGGSDWEQLNPTRKESSRASASHARVKEEILQRLSPSTEVAALRGQLEEGASTLKEMQQNLEGEAFRTELLSYLSAHPVLDFLTRLEHKRWCNAYYAMNFRQGPVKDEKRLTHPCLIDDWQIIRDEAFFRCHPEYDLISVFALLGDKSKPAEEKRA